MKPRERVQAALRREQPDRVPRFEIWIDALLQELGEEDPAAVYAHVGQDCILMPTCQPPSSNAWKNGVDEWGRVWRNGSYVGGVVDSPAGLAAYTPPLDRAG